MSFWDLFHLVRTFSEEHSLCEVAAFQVAERGEYVHIWHAPGSSAFALLWNIAGVGDHP